MARRIYKRRRSRRKHRGGGWFGTLKNALGRGASGAKNAAGNVLGRFFKRGAEKKDCSEDLRNLSIKINALIKGYLEKPVDVEKVAEAADKVTDAVTETVADTSEPSESPEQEQEQEQEGEGGEDDPFSDTGAETPDADNDKKPPQSGGWRKTRRRRKKRRKRRKRRSRRR